MPTVPNRQQGTHGTHCCICAFPPAQLCVSPCPSQCAPKGCGSPVVSPRATLTPAADAAVTTPKQWLPPEYPRPNCPDGTAGGSLHRVPWAGHTQVLLPPQGGRQHLCRSAQDRMLPRPAWGSFSTHPSAEGRQQRADTTLQCGKQVQVPSQGDKTAQQWGSCLLRADAPGARNCEAHA